MKKIADATQPFAPRTPDKEMAASSAWQIILIFSVMFIAITIATLWFAFSTSKLRSKKEIKEKKMEIIDKHFNEMIKIECPYCNIQSTLPIYKNALIAEPTPKKSF